MDSGITLPPMAVENGDSFMRTFAKNYAKIQNPQAKLRFYQNAMENMKAKGMRPREFLEAFKYHTENPEGSGTYVGGISKSVMPAPVSKGGAVRG